MGTNRSRQTKTSSGSLPRTETPKAEICPSVVNVGRCAVTTTERLCGLYVMVTMNMDFSLIKYYVQSGELQKWVKKCLSDGQTATEAKQV